MSMNEKDLLEDKHFEQVITEESICTKENLVYEKQMRSSGACLGRQEHKKINKPFFFFCPLKAVRL